MERRAHTRHPLTLAARIRAQGTDTHVCQIRDFCFGGLFLELQGAREGRLEMDGQLIGRDHPVIVYFTVPVNGAPRQFDISARVARVFSGGVGVAFSDPSPSAIAVLGDLAGRQREGRAPSPDAAAAPGADLDVASLLDGVIKATAGYLQSTVERLFKHANDKLFAGAQDAQSNAEQTSCFDAIREIDTIQEPVASSFLELVQKRIQGLGVETAEEDEELSSDRLSLVDTCTFDDWLVVKNIIAKAQPRLQKAQDHLDRRMSHLMGVSIADENNPVGLAGLCFSFHDCLQNMAAGVRARHAVFDAFHATFVEELDLLFEQLNALLVEGGVLPVIAQDAPSKQKKSKSRGTKRAGRDSAATHDPGAPPTDGQDSGGWDQHQVPLGNAYDGGAPNSGSSPTSGVPAGHGAPMPGGPAGGYVAPPVGGAPAAPVGPVAAHPAGAGGAIGVPTAPGVAGPGSGGVFGPSGGPVGAAPGGVNVDGSMPAAFPGQTMLPGYVPYWGPTAGHGMTGTGGALPSSAALAGGAGTSATAAATGPADDAYAMGAQGLVGARELGVGRAYQAAQSLLNLNRHLSAGGLGDVAGREAIATMSPAAQRAVASEELLGALTNLQRSAEFNDAERTGPLSLRERLVARLASAGVDVGDAEVEAVDVISSLLDSITADPLVNSDVKSRINRLAIPLLKAALHDAQFFDDLNHPARQVVNRLGRVELPAKAKAGYRGATIEHHVDPLLDRIVDQYDRDSRIFAEAVPELDALIQRQLQDYVEKVHSVVEEREKQQALMNTLRMSKSGEGWSEATTANNLPQEWKQWLARAKQLQVGDALTIDNGSGKAQPASLAWVAEDQNTFLFVDGQGEKAASLTLQELAMALRRGTTKPMDSAALPLMDRGFYRMLEGMHTKLTDDVNKDPLTGLLTRKAFEAHLRHVLAGASQGGWDHVVCQFDIDGFTKIDAHCGRKAGDGLLKKFSRVVEKHVRDRGVAARLQADDFAVLLENCSAKEASQIAERLRRSIEQSRVVWHGETLPLSISGGLVQMDEHAQAPRGLMEAVESACNKAKEAGGNRIHAFHDDSTAHGSQGGDVAEAASTPIVTLIDQGLIVLRSQRIVPMAEDAPDKPHYEVLLGLHKNGDYVAVPPGLVQAAERANEMRDVDRWVISTAFKWMAGNRRELMKVGSYAITLSGNTLCDDGLLEYVLAQFNETKVPPGKVVFEVTETAAIDSLSVAVGFIRTMKEYGCRFALDEFGSGHASYSYLKTLPVDYLKIDGLFVKDIVDSPNDFAMVKSMNDIAHVLGKQTIAEYVDSDEILDRLREIGVDYVQGQVIDLPQLLTEAG